MNLCYQVGGPWPWLFPRVCVHVCGGGLDLEKKLNQEVRKDQMDDEDLDFLRI